MERIFRLILCLIMVCSLLINCSPIQAEATGAGLATTYAAFAVAPQVAVSAVMIALGVAVVAGSAAVLGGVVSECEQFLVENGYISGDLVDVYRADADSRIQYMISRELVEVIRDWLFDSGKLTTKTAIAGSEISVTTWGSGGLSSLVRDSAENATALVKGLGVNSKVLILGGDDDQIWGIFFDELGRLSNGYFENPLGMKHCSLLGCHPIGSLTFVKSELPRSSYFNNISGEYSSLPIFYDVSWAEKFPDYLTSALYVIDWNANLYWNNNAYFHCLYKGSADSVITAPSGIYYTRNPFLVSGNIGSFTWDTTTQSVVSTDLDLNVSGVASPDKSFSEGYSEWASGAKSLPTLRNGEISDAESMYLSLGMADTLEETMALIQSQAQGGTITGSGTTSDTVTATGLKGWLDTLRMTLVDGFSDLKAGWAELTASLAGEKTEASTQGNQSVDQIIEIIPDDSQDYLAAFGSLVSVLSYEGTSAVIKMPALTVPALNGLFSEFTYLDEQEIDLEAYVNMLPEVVLTLIRALFDAALVLYCIKEFFGMISGFVNNFSDAKEVIYE